jgi:transcriptional regulator with XRE-family HTH domain
MPVEVANHGFTEYSRFFPLTPTVIDRKWIRQLFPVFRTTLEVSPRRSAKFTLSTLTIQTILPEVQQPPELHAREVVRCKRCQLVQFRTVSDMCRKCDFPLPPPPRLELDAATSRNGATGSHLTGEHHGLHSRTKTARELTIGRKLRELRDQRNFTQQDMADKAGVPRTYISRIENARLLPGPVMLRRIAEALQVEILDLLPANKNGNAAPVSYADQDPYWPCLSGYFVQLQPEQMAQVLETIRGMLGGVASEHFAAEAVMA